MSFYLPTYDSWFEHYSYDWYTNQLDKKYPWHQETIRVHAQIDRVISDSTIVFTLNGAQYDEFIRMSGTFVCVDAHGDKRLFTFQPDDVVRIIENNYEEIRYKWNQKREEYRQQLINEEKEKDRLRAEERRKKEEAEEAERMKHFWYRLFHRRKNNG